MPSVAADLFRWMVYLAFVMDAHRPSLNNPPKTQIKEIFGENQSIFCSRHSPIPIYSRLSFNLVFSQVNTNISTDFPPCTMKQHILVSIWNKFSSSSKIQDVENATHLRKFFFFSEKPLYDF